MGPYAPPPPPGATPPPRWGDEAHVRALFGDRADVEVRRATVVMDHVADPLEFREYWKRNYGPTIAVYAFNAGDPERVAQLDRDFLEFLTAWNDNGAYEAEYLVGPRASGPSRPSPRASRSRRGQGYRCSRSGISDLDAILMPVTRYSSADIRLTSRARSASHSSCRSCADAIRRPVSRSTASMRWSG